MPLLRRSLVDAAAARIGWRRTYSTPAQIDSLLREQAKTAYRNAPDHAALATVKHDTALAVQPGVLDVRGRVLADVVYVEGLLAGARARSLPKELIQRLEDVVDHGHELALLLAETVRTTAAVHANSSVEAASDS
ncbi:hypothetical protein [Streptomyces sp. NPDC127038]|uniref:hypothetical protein n=1 Tax=Streptomyces sp. NPDC127038 TaxID=3347114 RepID=UPI003663AF05